MVTYSFLKNSQSLKLEDATLKNELVLQNETVPPDTDGALLIEIILTPFYQKASEFRRQCIFPDSRTFFTLTKLDMHML
jgi:hypothetical protein